jgi:hypothetical protein
VKIEIHKSLTIPIEMQQSAALVSKKRKVDNECRVFKETWTLQYFFIPNSGKPLCLICNATVACNKECNLKRHYDTNHAKFDIHTGKHREEKLDNLKRYDTYDA